MFSGSLKSRKISSGGSIVESGSCASEVWILVVTVIREGLVEDEEHPHNSSGNRKTDKKRYMVFMGGLFVFSDIVFDWSNYRGAVFACQGVLCIEKQGLSMLLGEERWISTPLFYDALCFDVIVPGVLRVPIGVVVMNGDLRDLIRDGRGSRPACAVHADRRVMDFGRRPCSCQP